MTAGRVGRQDRIKGAEDAERHPSLSEAHRGSCAAGATWKDRKTAKKIAYIEKPRQKKTYGLEMGLFLTSGHPQLGISQDSIRIFVSFEYDRGGDDTPLGQS